VVTKKQNISRNQVKNRLITVELALGKLDIEFKATTYRQNIVVADCIKHAQRELESALESLFADRLQDAYDIASLAWLHTDFGKQILEAEAVEHLLGESEYIELRQAAELDQKIELKDICFPWESKAKELMERLEQAFRLLRNDIAAANQEDTNHAL